VQLRNTNPLGAVDLPLIGRTLEAGEVFEVDDKAGKRLLEQVGNYEAVGKAPATPRKPRSKAPVKPEVEAPAQTDKKVSE
jgi:hypothetical protein